MSRSRIAPETGVHSPWIIRLLSELGHEVTVAHARKVRLIVESHRKEDRFDARTLARLERIGTDLLWPVQHRSPKAQADLTVIRARTGLVRARTALFNTARGLTKSYGERLRGCSPQKMNRDRPTLSSIGLSVRPVVRFPRCLQACWRAAELASPLASVLCSRLTCEMEKASVRANFRQIQLRE